MSIDTGQSCTLMGAVLSMILNITTCGVYVYLPDFSLAENRDAVCFSVPLRNFNCATKLTSLLLAANKYVNAFG